MKLRIAILGTRGIPNYYGGFEHISEYVSEGLVKRGHSVTVYNSHNHPYQEDTWNGVEIRHCYDPEFRVGTAGQFAYDFNCLMDARKRNFDVVLIMGYTSSSVGESFIRQTVPSLPIWMVWNGSGPNIQNRCGNFYGTPKNLR